MGIWDLQNSGHKLKWRNHCACVLHPCSLLCACVTTVSLGKIKVIDLFVGTALTTAVVHCIHPILRGRE